MNDMIPSQSRYGSDWPRFLTLEDWIDEFNSVESDDDYPRSVTAVIPHKIADVYNTATVTVSIRALLTLAALHNPKDAERLLALRDAHYGGDMEEDYFIQGSENLINRTMSSGERGIAKAVRAKGFDEREAKRLLLEAEAALPRAPEEPLSYDSWHPFCEERMELAVEFEALRQRENAYAAEWERFAAHGVFTEAEHDRWANRRADLYDEEDAIARGYHEYAKRYEQLANKVRPPVSEQPGSVQ